MSKTSTTTTMTTVAKMVAHGCYICRLRYLELQGSWKRGRRRRRRKRRGRRKGKKKKGKKKKNTKKEEKKGDTYVHDDNNDELALKLFLVAWSIGRSVGRLVGPSVPFYFFVVFKQSKGRLTDVLTNTVTFRIACTRLMAIGLVFR